jgi:hypothetical protein
MLATFVSSENVIQRKALKIATCKIQMSKTYSIYAIIINTK